MSWRTQNRWEPELLPVLMVARKEDWPAVRSDVEIADPVYPIRLCVPFAQMRGYRFTAVDDVWVPTNMKTLTYRSWLSELQTTLVR